ncbi:MAG: hypothetical protein K2N90_10150 [Lachnospiraceae bacterium]|nr:hypothetical protein [Lachnospiraceae bacterium]
MIITDIGLLALGFSTVYAIVRRTYVFYATASSTVAAGLLAGVKHYNLYLKKEESE